MRPSGIVCPRSRFRSRRRNLALWFITVVPLACGIASFEASARPSWDGTWHEVVTAGGRPPARAVAPAVIDTRRSRMVVFGGTDDFEGGAYFNDVWALSLAEPRSWTELTPAGPAPSPRLGSAAAYDPVRDRVIVWSGYNGINDVGEVWALSLSDPIQWAQIVPVGTAPIGRSVASLVYDPVRDRMVMFGGFHEGAHNDAWALSLAGEPAWTQLDPVGPWPVGRGLHTGIQDPIRDRMVIFGGQSELGFLNDVWSLSFAGDPAWTELHPEGPPPPPRGGQCGDYDPLRDRLVVFSGIAADDLNAPPLEDVWALTLGEGATWSQLLPEGLAPRGRACAGGAVDAAGDALILFGGIDEGVYLDDTWALAWGGASGVAEEPRARLLVRGPNPLRPGDRIEVALDGPAGGLATLALYDVQGRRLGLLWEGGSGDARSFWSGAVRDLPIRAAGRYVLRAQGKRGALARTVVVLPEGR